MSDFNSLVQYTVENISRPIKYIIYKLTEFIRVVDKFVFRQVPAGAASGYANIEQIEGNTVVWNQLIQNGDFSDGTTGWSKRVANIMSVTDGVCSLIYKETTYNNQIFTIASIISGHKYYASVDVKRFTDSNRFLMAASNTYSNITIIIQTNVVGRNSVIWTSSANKTGVMVYSGYAGVVDSEAFAFTNLQFIDLTAIFGAGNEPTTVADFESWLAQNIGTLPYYDYNAGELLSVKMIGMQTQDSSQQTLDTIALDVTTITGINTATNVRETIFPNGMKQADREGTVNDTLDLLSDTATVNVGSRAYQSGDESDTSVITDGTTTYYALTTPIEYTDLQDANGNPLNPRYKVEQGGTEQVLPVNTSSPTTVAPTLTTTYNKNI